MTITLEQIDELRKRTGVNYSDAKDALENCNGDMLEAIVYLEKNKKTCTSKASGSGSGFFDKLNALIRKGSKTRCVMYKQDRVIFNISVNVLALIVIITIPLTAVTAIGLLIALITGHKLKLVSSSVDTSKVNETLEKVSNTVEQAKEKFSNSITVDNKNAAE